jgi:predicted TIM-barrel fold metal-dependent hydrolase
VTDTAARPRERKERLEDILVVDADVHVHESPGELIPYCEMPWRVALENIKDVQEFYLDIPGFSPGTTAYEAKFPSGQEGTRMVHDAEQMRRELDEIHVDIGILFPDHFLKIPVISQVEYAAALARAYNAWLLDKWCDPEKGLLGCVLACPQDPEDAAREIRKYAKEPGSSGSGATGSTIRSTRRLKTPAFRCSCTASPSSTQSSRSTPTASKRSSDGTSAATPSR